jgi:chromosome segregation ATPase
MTRYHKALGVCLVTVFGLWGCARGPESGGAGHVSGDKVKSLEMRIAKLEDDLRAVVAAREQLQTKLEDAEHAQVLLHQEIDRLQLVVKDRDELRSSLTARTSERDQLQTQYDAFRSNIKDLLGQAEASLQRNKPTAGLASRDKGSAQASATGN